MCSIGELPELIRHAKTGWQRFRRALVSVVGPLLQICHSRLLPASCVARYSYPLGIERNDMGMNMVAVGFGGLMALTVSAVADGKIQSQGVAPAQLQRLMACRALPEASRRLACFDQEAAALAQAVQRNDLVVIDREKARATRRSLFGFSVPDFGGLFGGDDGVTQVDGVVASAGYNRDGGWTVRLRDGSVWTQTDSTIVPMTPRAGEKVIIRRAAFGSFVVKVGNQVGFRAKRIG